MSSQSDEEAAFAAVVLTFLRDLLDPLRGVYISDNFDAIWRCVL